MALAARVITGADQTVELARKVEQACIELIWRQQPVASELRAVLGMFEISRDLQRVDHYIVDVAKHAVRLQDAPEPATWNAVKGGADLTERDLKGAVEAYRLRDCGLAQDVLGDESKQEAIFVTGIKAIQQAIRNDAEIVTSATEMLFVLTSLERIGEHALNIAWQANEMCQP
jgi:phosphate transport system protein